MTQVLVIEDSSQVRVIEDSADDLLINRGFKKMNFEHKIGTLDNYNDAMKYLGDAQKTLPKLIWLDLHLHDCTGFEIIQWIPQHKNM